MSNREFADFSEGAGSGRRGPLATLNSAGAFASAVPPSSDALYFIACVGEKRAYRARARDLYCSAWFNKARAYVEAAGSPWYVLSARYGLVSADAWIDPYDLALTQMRIEERRAWAEQVWMDLEPLLESRSSVVFLAGKRYREFLVNRIEGRGVKVGIPLEGLGIGKQLRWLGNNTP